MTPERRAGVPADISRRSGLANLAARAENAGGSFSVTNRPEGGTVLRWADWQGRGVLLSGDILQVVPSRHVSFMWSYPNLIPLSAANVRRMAEILEPFRYDAVYGSFSGRGQIDRDGKRVVAESVARYIARISEA